MQRYILISPNITKYLKILYFKNILPLFKIAASHHIYIVVIKFIRLDDNVYDASFVQMKQEKYSKFMFVSHQVQQIKRYYKKHSTGQKTQSAQ